MRWLPGEAMSCLKGGTEGFLNSGTSVLFPLPQLGRKSEPCEEETRFLVSWYNLPRARNFKSLFEFQFLPAQKYPAGISELILLAPTWVYVEIVRNVEIVLLVQNYPTCTSELIPLAPTWIYVEIVHNMDIVFLAQRVFYSPPFLGNSINHQMIDCLRYPRPSCRLRTYVRLKY